MGLDNGIYVKFPDHMEIPKDADKIELDNGDFWRKNYHAVEVLYWRKCWNVRSIILYAIGAPGQNKNEDGEYESEWEFGLEEIDKIIRSLKALTKNNYEDDGYCIYEDWKHFKRLIKFDIKQLKKLRKYLKKHGEAEAWFYDSY